MSNKKRWGDFDIGAYKVIKKSMMGESIAYCNGKNYTKAAEEAKSEISEASKRLDSLFKRDNREFFK